MALGFCLLYITMQTFAVPGTLFLSLLSGAVFGVRNGVLLVAGTLSKTFPPCRAQTIVSSPYIKPVVVTNLSPALCFIPHQIHDTVRCAGLLRFCSSFKVFYPPTPLPPPPTHRLQLCPPWDHLPATAFHASAARRWRTPFGQTGWTSLGRRSSEGSRSC